MFRVALLSLLMLPLAGCFNDAKIDASTQQAFEQSITKIADGLKDVEKDQFTSAVVTIIMREEFKDGFDPSKTAEDHFAQIREVMDGKTATEVIVLAEKINADNRTAALKVCVADKVPVLEARIEKGDSGHNIIVQVKNELDWSISGIRLSYSALSKGRSVPLKQDDFFIGVSGGIKPGETTQIRENVLGIPNEVDVTALIVEAVITDVQDANGHQLVREVNLSGAPEQVSEKRCM